MAVASFCRLLNPATEVIGYAAFYCNLSKAFSIDLKIFSAPGAFPASIILYMLFLTVSVLDNKSFISASMLSV
jgi:hypothetical protein